MVPFGLKAGNLFPFYENIQAKMPDTNNNHGEGNENNHAEVKKALRAAGRVPSGGPPLGRRITTKVFDAIQRPFFYASIFLGGFSLLFWVS